MTRETDIPEERCPVCGCRARLIGVIRDSAKGNPADLDAAQHRTIGVAFRVDPRDTARVCSECAQQRPWFRPAG